MDTIFTLWLVALAVGAVVLLYGLTQRRLIAEERAARRAKRRGLAFALFFAGLTSAALLEMSRRRLHPLGFGSEGGGQNLGSRAKGHSANLRDYHAQFAWVPVLVIAGLTVVAVLAWMLAPRRRAQAEVVRTRVRETLEDAIEETLDDLAAEPDPRRAIIACYARLERALAVVGFPRRRTETQAEHLARILGLIDIETDSITRLNDLYTRAKFSHHEVDTDMKDDAIAALIAVRDELRSSEERRRERERTLRASAASS